MHRTHVTTHSLDARLLQNIFHFSLICQSSNKSESQLNDRQVKAQSAGCLISPLSFTSSSSSSSLMISRPSEVTLKPCSTLLLFFSPGFVAEKQRKNCLCSLRVQAAATDVERLRCFSPLPKTLWDTLGSRKLRGSSPSPSLSHACPFFCLTFFFWAFPSSSDRSLSESARISSIL